VDGAGDFAEGRVADTFRSAEMEAAFEVDAVLGDDIGEDALAAFVVVFGRYEPLEEAGIELLLKSAKPSKR